MMVVNSTTPVLSTGHQEYPTGSKYVIIPKQSDYTSKLLLALSRQATIQLYHDQDFVRSKVSIRDNDQFYLSSDTIFPLIQSQLTQHQSHMIETFRNKYLFRQLLKQQFPDFIFDTVDLSNLPEYYFDFRKSSKYVVKPCTGFMGAGVRIIDEHTDLHDVRQSIESELQTFMKHYPNIFSSVMIIEQYIDSVNEYAVDMYYDHQGSPVIINIYCHPSARRLEYLQMLYYTSAEVFQLLYERIVDFFSKLNDRLCLRSFPIHGEFKIDRRNHLFPIEFNPVRFGGMGLTDLTYYAFHFHPVQAYFRNEKPNWSKIWKQHPTKIFCWLLAYNAADKSTAVYEPDHDLFKQLLPRHVSILNYEHLNYRSSPAFAIVYLSTENKNDLEAILGIEFNDCFVCKRAQDEMSSPQLCTMA